MHKKEKITPPSKELSREQKLKQLKSESMEHFTKYGELQKIIKEEEKYDLSVAGTSEMLGIDRNQLFNTFEKDKGKLTKAFDKARSKGSEFGFNLTMFSFMSAISLVTGILGTVDPSAYGGTLFGVFTSLYFGASAISEHKDKKLATKELQIAVTEQEKRLADLRHLKS
jgi:hypothetical protein